jgi:hypothetical protein
VVEEAAVLRWPKRSLSGSRETHRRPGWSVRRQSRLARDLRAPDGRGGRSRGDAGHGRRWVAVPITRRRRPTVGLGCSLWSRPKSSSWSSVRFLSSVVETRGAPSLSVVEEVALRRSRDPPMCCMAGTTTASGGFGRWRSWVVAVGGVEEMLITVGGGSPSPSPAVAGSRWAWAAPCGCGPDPAFRRRSSWSRPRPTSAARKILQESSRGVVENPGFGGLAVGAL